MKRSVLLDMWRGLAIVGMVIFHAVLILDFFYIVQFDMYDGWWLVFARVVQWSFLLLVGIGIVLSAERRKTTTEAWHRQRRRIGVLAFWSAAISFTTWLIIPHMMIWFGILHLIALGSLVTFWTSRSKALLWATTLSVIGVWALFHDTSTESLWLITLGVPSAQPLASSDFFPFIPWVTVILLGAIIAMERRRIVPRSIQNAASRVQVVRTLAWCGRNSLRIYITHVPIILIVLYVLGLVPPRLLAWF